MIWNALVFVFCTYHLYFVQYITITWKYIQFTELNRINTVYYDVYYVENIQSKGDYLQIGT